MTKRNPTRQVAIGNTMIGNINAIMVQSMCATRTTDIDATTDQVNQLHQAGAGLVRIAVDTQKDVQALVAIRRQSDANISVDLQENYRLAKYVAPFVDKIRYNPGHLFHHERKKSVQEKVRFLVDMAGTHDCAIRIGVNCGSLDPALKDHFPAGDSISPMVASALEHAELLDKLDFYRYCVSLKDSDPLKVIEGNRRFAADRPDIPLHLGVTEAGMPPEGIIKTRVAFEQLIGHGIGDTIRVSLTLPHKEKYREIEAGENILSDIANGRVRSVVRFAPNGLNIISCPSCSRVENEAFINLAHRVKTETAYATDHDITIAVMGCRVNGPGETDDADLGAWCGPKSVNLKRRGKKIGSFSYENIIPRLKEELDKLIAEQTTGY